MKPFPSNDELRTIEFTDDGVWQSEWQRESVTEPILNALRHISGQLDALTEILVAFRADVTGVTSVTSEDDQG